MQAVWKLMFPLVLSATRDPSSGLSRTLLAPLLLWVAASLYSVPAISWSYETALPSVGVGTGAGGVADFLFPSMFLEDVVTKQEARRGSTAPRRFLVIGNYSSHTSITLWLCIRRFTDAAVPLHNENCCTPFGCRYCHTRLQAVEGTQIIWPRAARQTHPGEVQGLEQAGEALRRQEETQAWPGPSPTRPSLVPPSHNKARLTMRCAAIWASQGKLT